MEQNLYQILGCTTSSTTEQILAEYRARARQLHPDKQSEPSNEFQHLQYAKEILSDPAKRQHYDLFLTMGSSIPLVEWMNNQDKLKQTMHWGASTNPILALPQQPVSIESPRQSSSTFENSWERHKSSTINAFRNYEI
ncbi:DnaJ-like protein subfamily C member 12 [Aphelenchoides besseyi]|nr:DnaJ-like protein subfamily C member 12 [Aphelenchoides besseyi]